MVLDFLHMRHLLRYPTTLTTILFCMFMLYNILLNFKFQNPSISFSGFRKFAVLEVAREDEFSPLKNGKGSATDSPETALRDLLNLHHNYITKAGGTFVDYTE